MGNETTNEERAQFGTLRIADILLDGGFVLMLAWHYLVLFSSVFGDLGNGNTYDYIFIRQLVLFLSLAVTFGVVWLFGKLRDRNEWNLFATPNVVYAAGLFAFVSSCLYAASTSAINVPVSVDLLIFAVVGASEGWLMCLWLRCFIECRGEKFAMSFAVDMMGGGLLAFLICCFQWPIGPIAAAVAPLLSSLVLAREKRLIRNAERDAQAAALEAAEESETQAIDEAADPDVAEAPAKRRRVTRSSWVMTAFAMIYALVFGCMMGTYVVADEPILMASNAVVLLGVVLAGAVIAWLPSDLSSLERIDSIHRVSLIMFVMGAVSASLSPGDSVMFMIAQIAILAGFNLFDFGVLVFEITSRHDENCKTRRIVSHTRPVVYLSLAAGLFASYVVMSSMPEDRIVFALMIVSGVSVVALVTTVLVPFHSFHPAAVSATDGESHLVTPMLGVVAAAGVTTADQPSDDWESPWRRACNDIARQYQLSPREKEIFFLVAKGRNADYIQQELVISTHTVKTHIANIYRKLDVHSSQELLDLVEKVRKAR